MLTFVGTRPEIIKLSRVISKLDKFTNHILVHTGQNYDYELNEIFFEDLEIRKPDYFLNVADLTATKTIGRVLIEADKILEKLNPEAVMVLGDTSCMSLLAAKKENSNISFGSGEQMLRHESPRELNRKILDHSADINITFSTISRNIFLMRAYQKIWL